MGSAVPNLAGFDLDETAFDEKQKSSHHTDALFEYLLPFWRGINRCKEAKNNNDPSSLLFCYLKLI